MDLNEYMELAARTDNQMEQVNGLLNAAMGMVGESAETLEHLKKVFFQGHNMNIEKLIEETGDTLWYIAKMARFCGITLDELAQRNIDKLRKRYPEGFTVKDSVERVI